MALLGLYFYPIDENAMNNDNDLHLNIIPNILLKQCQISMIGTRLWHTYLMQLAHAIRAYMLM